MTRRHKVIVIGASGFQRFDQGHKVECLQWDQLEKLPNLRDYDTIIINLITPPGPDTNWELFEKRLDVHIAHEILRTQGRIVVLGDPRFTWSVPSVDLEYTGHFLGWTGMEFTWDYDGGDTVLLNNHPCAEPYREYLRYLRRWEYSLRQVYMSPGMQEELYGRETSSNIVSLVATPMCKNRYEGQLASSIRFVVEADATGPDDEYPVYSTVAETGEIDFLPRVDLPERDAVWLVLQGLLGIEPGATEPEWVQKIVAPGQRPLDVQLAELDAKVVELSNERGRVDLERASCRQCLLLLYGTGEALEQTVRAILGRLGAVVEAPASPGKEDGWLTVQIDGQVHEGVLEVKSTRSAHFGEDGIRQLLEWMQRGVIERGSDYKGIFVGVSSIDLPLSSRRMPFGDSWVKSAVKFGIAALRCEDLFAVYVLHVLGKLDTGRFWLDLFNTSGVFVGRPYWEALKDNPDFAGLLPM